MFNASKKVWLGTSVMFTAWTELRVLIAEAISTSISAEFSFPNNGTMVPASDASLPSKLVESSSCCEATTAGSFL